jgi:hypothetical protein
MPLHNPTTDTTGATAFTGLSDVPANYTDAASKLVSVKADESGLEFTSPVAAGMANPMTTAGDMIYGGADGAPARLAKGDANQVLTMNDGATAPEWAAAASTTVVGQAVFTVEGAVALSTGTLRIYNCLGKTATISEVFLSAGTAPTGAALIVDVNLDGTTIFTTQSNRPQIAADANTGNTTTIEVASWQDGHYLTMDVDQVGSGVAGSDLTVHVVYSYTA